VKIIRTPLLDEPRWPDNAARTLPGIGPDVDLDGKMMVSAVGRHPKITTSPSGSAPIRA
jgi:hypothetical protein